MTSSPRKEEKMREQQPPQKREPYQTPDIIYEGKISIRAGSPFGANGFNEPGNPFNEG